MQVFPSKCVSLDQKSHTKCKKGTVTIDLFKDRSSSPLILVCLPKKAVRCGHRLAPWRSRGWSTAMEPTRNLSLRLFWFPRIICHQMPHEKQTMWMKRHWLQIVTGVSITELKINPHLIRRWTSFLLSSSFSFVSESDSNWGAYETCNLFP